VSRLLELDAYVTGEMADADAFEEAMFDAPEDPDLVFIDNVQRHGARLVEHGSWDMGCTREHVEDLIRAGHKVHVTTAGPAGGPRYALSISREADLIVTVLPLGRPDLGLLDVEMFVVDHNITKTIKDVRVDPTDGNLYGLCERPLAELAYGAGPVITRVRLATGSREVIAEWDLVGV
jgi:hypothetical protein